MIFARARHLATENDFVLWTPTRAWTCRRRYQGAGRPAARSGAADGVARPVRRNRRGRWCSQPPARGGSSRRLAVHGLSQRRRLGGRDVCGNGVSGLRTTCARSVWGGAEFVVATLADPGRSSSTTPTTTAPMWTVEMGKPAPAPAPPPFGGRRLTGLGKSMSGNPHLASVVPGLTADGLAALDVGAPVEFGHRAVPRRVNVEGADPRRRWIAVRCGHTSGCGRNRSCGTGTVAATVAALPADRDASTGSLRVRVPGGEVSVEITDTTSFLRGPSILVARG